MLALLESLEVEVQRPARVVLNERTGTVVMGHDVRIDTVAIAHGGLSIQVDTEVGVSQPAPFSQGTTEVIEQSDITAREELRPMRVVQGVSIAEVVSALNALGVSPRDLISILQAIAEAGALDAELEVI
jgi:flagellar P-ring protein precursor FlgI